MNEKVTKTRKLDGLKLYLLLFILKFEMSILSKELC